MLAADDFFDGNSGGVHVVEAAPYTPVSRDTHQSLPVGPKGLTGVVIPRAPESSMAGVPLGDNPHYTADAELVIDPHIPEQSIRLRIGDITAAAVHAASVKFAGTPPATKEQSKLRASEILHQLAVDAKTQGQHMNLREAPLSVGTTIPREHIPTSTVPLHSFGNLQPPVPQQQFPQGYGQQPQYPQQQQYPQMPQQFMQRPGGMSLPPSQTAPVMPANPPRREIMVRFSFKNFGDLEVPYYDVEITENVVVLVQSLKTSGTMRFQPPQRENEEIALHVEGTNMVFGVAATGITFDYEDKRFCVLVILRSMAMPGGEDYGEARDHFQGDNA